VYKALLQHPAAAVGPRHRRRAGRALQTDGAVAQRLEGAQVASGPAGEVQQIVGWWPWDVLQKRRDVLADVVVERAFPVALGVLLVRQGPWGDVLKVFGTQWHGASFHAPALVCGGAGKCSWIHACHSGVSRAAVSAAWSP
jgi:hypothetical protein